MDPPSLGMPPSPGTPLFPLSPERVNGTRPPYGSAHVHSHYTRFRSFDGGATPTPRRGGDEHKLPQSPSLPCLPDDAHPFTLKPSATQRDSTDVHVQGMVARFNHLEIRDPAEARRRDELALKREQMAREMADAECRRAKEDARRAREEARKIREDVDSKLGRIREDGRRMQKVIEEGRDRERKIAKRLEACIEDYHTAQQNHAQKVALYDKEVKRSRKEAFKSASTVVKLQEELKSSRTALRAMSTNLESEKARTARREQESFTAQYQLVGVQEALDTARERIKTVEAERDALKTSLKEEEVARIAAQGRIALPVSSRDEDEAFASPTKSPTKLARAADDDKENQPQPSRRALDLRALQEELEHERRGRVEAEGMVDFLKIECQFGVCSCRVAENCGRAYVHDRSLEADVRRVRAAVVTPPTSADEEMGGDEGDTTVTLAHEVRGRTASIQSGPTPTDAGQVTFSPDSGTFHDISQTARVAPGAEPPQAVRDPALQSITEVASSSILLKQDEMDVDEDAACTEPSTDPAAVDETGQESEDTIMEPAIADIDIDNEASTPTPRAHTPAEDTAEDHFAEQEQEEEDEDENDDTSTTSSLPPSAPATPAHHTIRTITTTTTVPLAFSPATPSAPATPATVAHPPAAGAGAGNGDLPFDREAALAAIRQRRGRARSMAAGHATPRKQMLEGVQARRDISAPALRAGR